LRVGRVLDKSGRELPDFKTFQPVTTVFIRGGRTSKVRRCDVCRTLLYAPVKMQHLLGKEGDFGGLFGTNLSGTLIVEESFAARLADRRFKNLGISQIKVLAAPIDGFGADLETVS
jgi:hypothetical protein